MNTPPDIAALKSALMRAGYEKELDRPGADGVLRRMSSGLADFIDYYERRFRERVDPFAWWDRNPTKAQAFFQFDTLALSPEMKAAVWRILLGSDVQSVWMDFRPSDGVTRLQVVTRTPYGDDETFTSDVPDDVRLLRHLGLVTVGGRLELQGYHALRR